MELVEAIKFGLKALMERRTRSILTILGIAIGTALIIALVANGQGLNDSITNKLLELGANNIVILPSTGSSLRFNDADVQKISLIPGVEAVLPFYLTSATVKYGGISLNGRVYATDPASVKILFPQLTVLQGTPPIRSDSTSAAIGYKLAFPPDYPGVKILPGQSISVEVVTPKGKTQASYVVSCVYDEFGATLFVDADTMVLITIPGGRRLFGESLYHGILVRAIDPRDVDYIIDQLSLMYGRNANIVSPTSILRTVQSILGSFTFFLAVIAAVSLLVAGIGIANTMIMSVMERVREIGVLRAIGMTKRDIMIIFLSEASLTGAIGGILGIMLGVMLSYGVSIMTSSLFHFEQSSTTSSMASFGSIPYEPTITPLLLIQTFFFAIMIGMISGIYPARRAASLDPVVALRTEQ
ncbi:MAG: FtsX-like permease family protein [Nitrososphaerota archaeon]